jgi:O-antigen/teichoic acid export membrane protein
VARPGPSGVSPETAATDTRPELEAEQEVAAATTGATVVRGGLWSLGAKVLPQFSTLAVSIAGARFLGASGLGRQSFIAFVATSAIYVLGFGLPLALMRQIGESVGAGEAARARGLVRWMWRFAFLGGTIGFLGMIAVALGGAEPKAAWILAGPIVAAGVLTQMPDAVISGLQRWRDSALIVLCSAVLGALVTIAVLAAGGGVTGMIAVQLAVAIGILAAMAPVARRRLLAVAPLVEDPGALRGRVLRYSGAVFLGSLLTLVVFRRSELFFLNHYSNDREIALYSVAFSFTATLILIPQSLANVVAPAVATIFGAGQMDRIRSGYSRTLRLLALGALPVAAAGLALGPELVVVLFGHSFRGSATPLLILLVAFPLIPLMNASYSVIVGLGKAKFPLIAGAGSAVVNIALDFALIPPYEATGAAVANALAQGSSAIAIVFYSVRLVGGVRWEADSIARMALTSAVAGVSAHAALNVVGGGVAGFFVGAVAGVAVFALIALVLRVIPHDDGRWLRDSFGSALGGVVGTAVRRLEAR